MDAGEYFVVRDTARRKAFGYEDRGGTFSSIDGGHNRTGYTSDTRKVEPETGPENTGGLTPWEEESYRKPGIVDDSPGEEQ